MLSQATEVPWLTIVGQGGLLIVAVVLFQGIKMLINGTLHGDKEFRTLESDRNFYRDIALRSLRAGESIADAAKSVTPEELERVAYEAAAKASRDSIENAAKRASLGVIAPPRVDPSDQKGSQDV